MAVGTPGYMSPERILDRDDDSPAADLWALGATLFASIRGQGPYDGYREITAACLAITTEEPPEIPEAWPAGWPNPCPDEPRSRVASGRRPGRAGA